jgi:hypothetical protein
METALLIRLQSRVIDVQIEATSGKKIRLNGRTKGFTKNKIYVRR